MLNSLASQCFNCTKLFYNHLMLFELELLVNGKLTATMLTLSIQVVQNTVIQN